MDPQNQCQFLHAPYSGLVPVHGPTEPPKELVLGIAPLVLVELDFRASRRSRDRPFGIAPLSRRA